MRNSKPSQSKLSTSYLLPRFALFTLLLIGACLGGALLYTVVRQYTLQEYTIKGDTPQFQSAGEISTPEVNALGTPAPGTSSSAPEIEPTLTAWDGVGRVTVLLLGLDFRDWDAGNGASRSDTMILLTLDPLEKTAGILSIPRDMWVAIPGFQHGKINTAYYLGDAYKLPGGGPGLAVKTVEQFLGVPINFYAQIDFEAFIRFIDEIGGVKVNVPEKIVIDPLGDNNTKSLKPGVQTLPGDLTLAYARQRHTAGGDFDRARRQQQVIMGIRNRILSVDMLPTLITKAPALYQELAAGIHTNLSLDDAIKLARLANEIPDDKIRQGVLDSRYVIFGRSPDNLSILVPIPDKIGLLRDEIFASSGALSPLTEGNTQEKMKAENARIAVRNGTSSPELSTATGDYLRSQGMNVVEMSEAVEHSTVSSIVNYTGKPYTMSYLVDLMGISPYKIISNYDANSPVDVEVILGSDWARKNPLQ